MDRWRTSQKTRKLEIELVAAVSVTLRPIPMIGTEVMVVSPAGIQTAAETTLFVCGVVFGV